MSRMLERIMDEYDQMSDDGSWDEGHPIFIMAQTIDRSAKVIMEYDNLAKSVHEFLHNPIGKNRDEMERRLAMVVVLP